MSNKSLLNKLIFHKIILPLFVHGKFFLGDLFTILKYGNIKLPFWRKPDIGIYFYKKRGIFLTVHAELLDLQRVPL